MKKILLALFIGLTVGVFGQAKDANTLKNEGNEAYKNKDFAGAFKAYSEALKLLEVQGTVDTALIYNAGYCAFKAELKNEALPYFQKSIELGYKESKPYQMIAVIQYDLKDVDGMIATCEKGLEKYNGDEKLKEYASKGYLKKGLEFYNAGNKIKKDANDSGMNATDPEKFTAEYVKADDEFKKALPFMEKAVEYNPANENALKALENIYTSLDMPEKAAEVKAKMGTK